MNRFFKVLGATVAVFSAVIAALAVLDGICNKNRIRTKYIVCGNGDMQD